MWLVDSIMKNVLFLVMDIKSVICSVGKQTEDTLQHLLAKNTQEIEAAHPCLDIVYSHKIAKFLFALAKALKLPNETKYLALEILQRWVLLFDEVFYY